ncbi:NADH dehydrogenase-like complex subunit CD [Haladaptatus paucihalophilus DX253]|uniref:NADH dehydrogenase subunit C /NADH dehydrogenase subunit D n=1 Tax=Haladaptatus paucihalophilus DX253 TaxID=797209 RepID=E7QRF0_HALPU|nr:MULTISPECIES: NADH-quinone oxidoreductase subunit D [Haladaptatus]EFW92569.1 NADH dehydrogenase-like complex subunit CD [Haladaptatus paucihalophilus DX253]ODR80438.1 NADH-quinone oxidoreductase subunit C [Haladaptatus sp. W1]GKZ13830.1 NADH dehydrogenase subunit D [Haladaptatus sp. T7]SHK18946.1 NADH dehydrogenase subunit C /NADH dehydrogenase subunit D [Haladaptatus paucihalophilus DX253]
MSSQREVPAAQELDGDQLAALLGDHVIGREEHLNAPGFVVRPDEVQDALTILRDEAGFDHLSMVTAQDYEDRYESVYHLKKYADPTQEVSVVVPTPTDAPASQTAEPVYRSADWHEREAYDLVGIDYDGHPDLRRILLPETWQGHPLAQNYDQDRPQIVSFEEHKNPIQDDHYDADSDTMFLNIGPHHPATHGVLHLKTTLDGEQVADVDPDIGYLHRCEEQMAQNGTYRHQIMPYPDRWDYASAGLLNEWAYARVAEDLNDLDVPEYAQIIRTMGAELCRIASHMLALGTFCLDIYGDFTAIFMYAMRDREIVQNILEDLTGQRMMFNYFRLGGVVWDIPEPRQDFFDKIRDFLDDLPPTLEEYHDLITSNELFQIRTIGTGVLEPEVAKQYGVTGPVARASGIDYDLRRDDPYGYYDQLDWDVVTEDGCDNYARLLVRMREVEESAKIIDQCVDLLEDWPEDEREIQSNVPRTLKPDADTETYRAVEGAKGELGIYIRSDGTDKPGRFKIRSPCFCNLSALGEMSNGEYIPDLVATLGSLDVILGEVDR